MIYANDRVIIFLLPYRIYYHIFQPWPHPIIYHHPGWLPHRKSICCWVKESRLQLFFSFFYTAGEKSQQSLSAWRCYRSPLFFFLNSTYLCGGLPLHVSLWQQSCSATEQYPVFFFFYLFIFLMGAWQEGKAVFFFQKLLCQSKTQGVKGKYTNIGQ